MNVREEVESMKKEVQDLEQQSLAMELVKDYKKSNKRWFVAWIITFLVSIGLIGYIFFLLNDIGEIKTEQEIRNVNSIDRSKIVGYER